MNVPIGLLVAFLAAHALPESGRRRGRFDLPGAITASLGLALLVYGLSNAATSTNGVSHWGDTKVIVSLGRPWYCSSRSGSSRRAASTR